MRPESTDSARALEAALRERGPRQQSENGHAFAPKPVEARAEHVVELLDVLDPDPATQAGQYYVLDLLELARDLRVADDPEVAGRLRSIAARTSTPVVASYALEAALGGSSFL